MKGKRRVSKTKAIVRDSDTFTCTTCNPSPQFKTSRGMCNHLRKVHKLKSLKGTKSMTLHLDGPDYYFSQYEWRIGKVTLLSGHTRRRRKGEEWI